MVCAFCHQDVKAPCHDTQEISQRAMSHIDRCEEALRDDLSDGSAPVTARAPGAYDKADITMTKNPWMSLWLSANTWAGAARGFWAAEMSRQQKAMLNEMTGSG